MSFELRTRLILLAGAFLAYLIVPSVVSTFMGSQDAVWMHLSMSMLVKAAIGAVVAIKLLALRRPLSVFVKERVASTPAARDLPDADLTVLCDQGCLLVLFLVGAFILVPLLEVLIQHRGLLLLSKLGVLLFGLFLAYNMWKTFETALSRGSQRDAQTPPRS